jgi:hypothetical protein
MKKIFLFVMMAISLSSISCKKETTSPTQAVLAARKLSTLLGGNSGNKAIVASRQNGAAFFSASSYTITDDGFIFLVDGQNAVTLNLGYLVAYTVNPVSSNVQVSMVFAL